jgi:hypothetical protein
VKRVKGTSFFSGIADGTGETLSDSAQAGECERRGPEKKNVPFCPPRGVGTRATINKPKKQRTAECRTLECRMSKSWTCIMLFRHSEFYCSIFCGSLLLQLHAYLGSARCWTITAASALPAKSGDRHRFGVPNRSQSPRCRSLSAADCRISAAWLLSNRPFAA